MTPTSSRQDKKQEKKTRKQQEMAQSSLFGSQSNSPLFCVIPIKIIIIIINGNNILSSWPFYLKDMIKRVNEEEGKGSHENCLRLQQKIARKRGEIATKTPENVTKRAENVRAMTPFVTRIIRRLNCNQCL